MQLEPGAVVGILGGGQLARMLAIEAQKMGYFVHIFDPNIDCPASSVCNKLTTAKFTELSALKTFAREIDVLTFEFENIPVDSLQDIKDLVKMRPNLNLFKTTQNRIDEKQFLNSSKLPLSPFQIIEKGTETITIPLPAFLKTSNSGYDGKGQRKIAVASQLKSEFEALGRVSCTLETIVDLAAEVSMLVARDVHQRVEVFGPIENLHHNNILHTSTYPASVSEKISSECSKITKKIANDLNLVGLICVEFFIDKNHKIYVNEIAPRTHNSGHLTIEACLYSQFNQQIRAVCGLDTVDFYCQSSAKMTNILGDTWPPNWQKVLDQKNSQLHLYGKKDARPGRKMGHFTTLLD